MRTLEQVRQVLAGTQAMQFQATADDAGRYAWELAAFCSALTTAAWPGQSAALCWPTCSA